MARIEKDMLGEKVIPDDALWGIHTARAIENFPVSNITIHPRLFHAYGEVKLACAKVNFELGYLDKEMYILIAAAAKELIKGELDRHCMIDAFQGGAGTSTNFNVCEVIANRALQLAGRNPGEYQYCDPIAHINMHQSTNDTFPTAMRISVLRALQDLEPVIIRTLGIMQLKEQEFANVVKVARTELMDAVPVTLGKTFGSWAEAISRDRWRIFKSAERVRVVNLGGTAVGTGLGAPRDYIFRVVDELRNLTGLPLARAENLIDSTQNADVWVEVMGMLKAHAATIAKISGDLRLMAMGPDCGIGEIRLPALQAGSSIMPGKINPVIPEMLTQVAYQVAGCDQTVTWSAASGQLELNAFLPIVAFNLLWSIDLLTKANTIACERCFSGIEACTEKCRQETSESTAMATVLVRVAGYHQTLKIVDLMKKENIGLKEAARRIAGMLPETIDQLLAPESVNSLGFTDKKRDNCIEKQ